MRIAYVSNIVEPTGGDNIVYNHVIGLRKRGHVIDTYFSGWHEAYQNTTNNWKQIQDTIIFYKDLKQYDFSKYDIVVANGLYGANKTLDINHPKKIWFCQNFDPYIFGSSSEVDGVYNQCNSFLLYSNALKKIIKHYYGNKNFIMCSNGIEYNKFKPFQKQEFLRNKRVAFIVAYYRNYKGIVKANEIFQDLKSKGYITVEINVVGGPLLNTMEYYRNPSFERKSQIISECDFSIHPSIFETWNLTSMESMALGTPVIGFNSLGIMEYANNSNSIIFDERNIKNICNAIEGLYNNQDKYRSIQKNGILTAEKYDWDNIILNIEQKYKEFLEM